MKKYKITLFISNVPMASFVIESTPDMINEFIYRFYPDTNYEIEEM